MSQRQTSWWKLVERRQRFAAQRTISAMRMTYAIIQIYPGLPQLGAVEYVVYCSVHQVHGAVAPNPPFLSPVNCTPGRRWICISIRFIPNSCTSTPILVFICCVCHRGFPPHRWYATCSCTPWQARSKDAHTHNC